MGLFGLGNRTKHKKFGYIPRYYDPDKEDLQNRLSRYQESSGEEHDIREMKHRIRSMYSNPSRSGVRYDDRDTYKKAVQRSNKIILIVFLVMIAIVAYFILAYMPSFLSIFE